MISKETAPLGWTMLMYELDDAHEHLAKLIQQMSSEPGFSEDEFRIHLGHVFAHLNRAWRMRNDAEGNALDDMEWDETVQFPTDLKPM
jgi:hypothetical protein